MKNIKKILITLTTLVLLKNITFAMNDDHIIKNYTPYFENELKKNSLENNLNIYKEKIKELKSTIEKLEEDINISSKSFKELYEKINESQENIYSILKNTVYDYNSEFIRNLQTHFLNILKATFSLNHLFPYYYLLKNSSKDVYNIEDEQERSKYINTYEIYDKFLSENREKIFDYLKYHEKLTSIKSVVSYRNIYENEIKNNSLKLNNYIKELIENLKKDWENKKEIRKYIDYYGSMLYTYYLQMLLNVDQESFYICIDMTNFKDLFNSLIMIEKQCNINEFILQILDENKNFNVNSKFLDNLNKMNQYYKRVDLYYEILHNMDKLETLDLDKNICIKSYKNYIDMKQDIAQQFILSFESDDMQKKRDIILQYYDDINEIFRIFKNNIEQKHIYLNKNIKYLNEILNYVENFESDYKNLYTKHKNTLECYNLNSKYKNKIKKIDKIFEKCDDIKRTYDNFFNYFKIATKESLEKYEEIEKLLKKYNKTEDLLEKYKEKEELLKDLKKKEELIEEFKKKEIQYKLKIWEDSIKKYEEIDKKLEEVLKNLKINTINISTNVKIEKIKDTLKIISYLIKALSKYNIFYEKNIETIKNYPNSEKNKQKIDKIIEKLEGMAHNIKIFEEKGPNISIEKYDFKNIKFSNNISNIDKNTKTDSLKDLKELSKQFIEDTRNISYDVEINIPIEENIKYDNEDNSDMLNKSVINTMWDYYQALLTPNSPTI